MAKPTPAQITQAIIDVVVAIGMAIIAIFK